MRNPRRYHLKEKKYRKRLDDFNSAAGTSYIQGVHFVTFRITRKGMLVGYTIGKPEEIKELRWNVEKAGAPYYCKF